MYDDSYVRIANMSVERVKQQVNDVRAIMMANIDKVMQRDEKLHLLMHKSDSLAHASQLFQRSTSHVRQQFKNKRWKVCILISVLVLILIIAIFAIVSIGKKS